MPLQGDLEQGLLPPRAHQLKWCLMLRIDGISVFYGAIQALTNVSLEVKEGEIVAIIGSNGAGKSTLLKTVSSLLRPRTGSITFEGQDLVALSPDRVVRLGISQSPEGRRIFTNMTVHENLLLGAFIRSDDEIESDMERVLDRFRCEVGSGPDLQPVHCRPGHIRSRPSVHVPAYG